MYHIVAVTNERIRTLLPVHLFTAGSDQPQEPRSRPRGAEFYQFLHVSKGTGIFESPQGRFRLTEGMTVFTAKGCPAAYRGITKEFYTGWVTFDGPQAKSVLEYLGAGDVAVVESEAVRARMLDAYRLAERGAPAEELSLSVMQLVVTFFGEFKRGKKAQKLQCAREYILTCYAQDLSVAQIAQAAGVSESLLFRLFRQEENTTPTAFLRSVRIQKSKELLLGAGNGKVSEIALRVGFSDTAYFCKVFKAETGMTPRAYRTRYAL